MTSAVIVSTARTPLAKSWKGAFNLTHGATLGGHAVKHAVQRHGAQLHIESKVGQGSVFSVHFPARRLRTPSSGA